MGSIDRSFDEKRNFIRMKINTPVSIHMNGRVYQGICKDLSGAGMLIETDDEFSIGDQLDVTIEQKNDNQIPFNAKVEVTRIQAGSPGTQVIGLLIKEID